ncbi:TonB-dependent receptor [Snuella sedimenti]|uniref:Carboxypeptidase-like regulatory domain-containing protein n=1 Tax=Snuella sedimenti TaxID=2798802 RepID=A0A8J7LRS7_9FLAO|nr:TonB-dependent receptor [Snuella sedimenti]MBJ6367545.1 carboxypeptidase-like regulatory domain-containing protein [Snuella sedimenti]
MKTILPILAFFFSGFCLSQTTVKGSVVDDNNQPIPGVNIVIIGTSTGTVSDFDGNFILTTNETPPFSVQASSVGFETAIQEVTANNQTVDFILNEGNKLDEIVISASRTPESVRESPVTIERFDIKDIKFASSPNFYTSLENLKGVDVHQGSLTFNSVNTRGFATYANTRFVQLVDGMDNALPGLNFALGNILGLSELDINSVEILPGASSALYGANAFNGILFMTSKNPFDYHGVSAYYKTGLTVQDEAGDNQFHDFGVRAAHVFSDKFAAKASFSYMRGTDWYASDNNQYTLGPVGTADAIQPFRSGPAHDGLNIYGDEVSLAANGLNLNQVAQQLEAGGILPPGASMLVPEVNVARTGYRESDLTDYKAESIKAYFTLNYRPFGDNTEIVLSSKIGKGSSIYQGANRYAIKDFDLQQHKLEFKGDNFFLRGYTTIENAGNSYDMRFTGINMNKVGATQWFGAYAAAYAQGAGQILAGGGNPNDPATQSQIHAGARVFADTNFTPQPGSPEFKALFNKVTSDPDVTTGSKLVDNTKMHIGEGNYNFKDLLNNVMDLQIGGSYREYSLNSSGSVFTDYDGSIDYHEYGAYIQGIKKLMDDRLKITASLRLDKNEFFDPRHSPRLSLGYSAGENKEHNFRASFQTGFRNPHTQALFIGFDVSRAILVGAAPDNLDRDLPNTDLTGRDAYFNSYTLSSVLAFQASGGTTQLMPVRGTGITPLVEQEKVTAFDVGYRGKLGIFTVDFNAYYSTYNNFIAEKLVVTPKTGSVNDATGVLDVAGGNVQIFNVFTNSSADVNSYGGVVGLSTKIAKDYDFGVNYTYAKLDFDQASDPDFSAGFNTPEHKIKVSLGNSQLFKNFGFNINARWSDEYLWQASIANAVIPSRTVVDAQINYTIPSMKSVFKVGGTNLGGKEFQSAIGSPFIGSQYFISWTINN